MIQYIYLLYSEVSCPMARYSYGNENVESKSEKHVRIFLAILFFVQTVVTTFPFIHGTVDEGFTYVTAFNMLIQQNGYTQQGAWMMAIIGAILVIFPIVAFFFCVLDKKSKKKYIVSGLCSILCAAAITFSMGSFSIAFGAVLTLIINVVALFMTAQGYQATMMRERNQ